LAWDCGRKRAGLLAKVKAAREEQAASAASGSLWQQLVPSQASQEAANTHSFSFSFA